MIPVNRSGEVWVFAEQEEGSLHDIALELCGKARQLADQLGVKMAAVLSGWNVRELSQRLFAHGADRVYLVEDRRLEHYQTQPYAKILCTLIDKHRPQIVIYGATPLGRDLAPRIASAMKAGLTADCTALEISDVTDPKTQQVHRTCCSKSVRRSAATSSPRSSTGTAGRKWRPCARASCPCSSRTCNARAKF